MRTMKIIGIGVIAIFILMSGVALAQSEAKDQEIKERYSSMQERNKQVAKELDENKFFNENLIALDRMNNQEITINEEREMEIVDFLVDPMTGNVEYMIVASE